jgi:hypothetical protein
MWRSNSGGWSLGFRIRCLRPFERPFRGVVVGESVCEGFVLGGSGAWRRVGLGEAGRVEEAMFEFRGILQCRLVTVAEDLDSEHLSS